MIHLLQPLRFKHPMTPTPLTHHPRQPLLMRMRNSHGIKPTSAQPPGDSPFPIKLLSPIHPIKQGRPQTIRGCRVLAHGRTIARPWDFDTNSSPTTGEMTVLCVRHFRPVSVQPKDLDDTRYRVRSRGMLW